MVDLAIMIATLRIVYPGWLCWAPTCLQWDQCPQHIDMVLAAPGQEGKVAMLAPLLSHAQSPFKHAEGRSRAFPRWHQSFTILVSVQK